MKAMDKLIGIIPKLDTVEFIGLARLLKVPLMEPQKGEEKEKITLAARDFTNVLNDVLAAFDALGRDRKREILRLLKGVGHASNSKDS